MDVSVALFARNTTYQNTGEISDPVAQAKPDFTLSLPIIFSEGLTQGLDYLVREGFQTGQISRNRFSQYLWGNKLLLDNFIELRKEDPLFTLTAQLNGEDLLLEQVGTDTAPILQFTFQGETEQADIPMTIDAWAYQLMLNLGDPDRQTCNLYKNIINANDRERYDLSEPWNNLNFKGSVFISVQAGYSIVLDFSSVTTMKGADFSGAKLHGLQVPFINLSKSNFTNADLLDADLRGTDFSGSNLSDADLTYANLSNATMSNAEITTTKFSNANLTGTKLGHIELRSVQLTPRQFSEADLTDATLDDQPPNEKSLKNFILSLIKRGAKDLRSINLSGMNLCDLDLFNANVWNSNLSHTDLSGADLTDANLTNANLTGATMADVCLLGADLTNAVLDDIAEIALRLPNWESENWDSNRLAEELDENFISTVDKNLLTMINSIDGQYKHLKISLVHQIIDSLQNTDIYGVRGALLEFFLKDEIYARDEIIVQFIIDKILGPKWTFSTARYGIETSKLETAGELKLQLLLYTASETIKSENSNYEKRNSGISMLDHNNFMHCLMVKGLGHENQKIDQQAAQLYQEYMNLKELAVDRSCTFISERDEHAGS